MEIVWEKGGSGLVFHTDAAFWDKQSYGGEWNIEDRPGDLDERLADSWDVPTALYYEPTHPSARACNADGEHSEGGMEARAKLFNRAAAAGIAARDALELLEIRQSQRIATIGLDRPLGLPPTPTTCTSEKRIRFYKSAHSIKHHFHEKVIFSYEYLT